MHWLIALLLLGVGIATAYGYAQRKPVARLAAAETTAPVVELAPAELFTVKPAQLRHTVHLSGSLRPVHQSVLKAEVGARVGEVLVQEGQSVTKGDVLARLDRADVTSRLNEKLMLLEQASAQLALAEKTRAAKLELKEKGFATQASVNEVESTYRVQLGNVRAIETQIEIARKAQNDATILAPISGFIAERSINPGEKVAIDGKLMTIVDLSELELEAMISANDITRVAVGQTVEFLVPGLEQKQLTGRVVRINPTTKTGTRSIPVYVQVRNETNELRGGMFAIGNVVVGSIEQLVAVPITAVRTGSGQSYVLKIADGAVIRQPVVLKGGPDDTELVAVVEGLAPGDLVISAPSINLQPGTRVRIAAQ